MVIESGIWKYGYCHFFAIFLQAVNNQLLISGEGDQSTRHKPTPNPQVTGDTLTYPGWRPLFLPRQW